jgi:hypothetical protein
LQDATLFLVGIAWCEGVKICWRGKDEFSYVSEVALAQVTGERRILGANGGKPFLHRQAK